MKDDLKGYYGYWGKAEKAGGSYHLLPYHCLDVAAVGHVLLKRDPSLRKRLAWVTGFGGTALSYWLHMFLSLHDVGKFSFSFQGLRPDIVLALQGDGPRKQYSIRHDSLGQTLWQDDVWQFSIPQGEKDDVGYWQYILEILSKSFTGHHGLPPRITGLDNLRIRVQDYFSKEDLEAARFFAGDARRLFTKRRSFGDGVSLEKIYDQAKTASWLVAGLVVLSDWIGSNTSWFEYNNEPMAISDYWRKRAITQAEVAIREAGIAENRKRAHHVSFTSLFPTLTSATPLQEFATECKIVKSPQLFILEDITGSGKTEAALILARRMIAKGLGRGLFIALPTMATSNSMFERMAEPASSSEPPLYRKLFANGEEPSIVLTHSARHLSDTFGRALAKFAGGETEHGGIEETAAAQCASWLADNRKKALLSDVGVGTIDQALLAVLPSRFQSLRLFGLARNILIVDEVHSYDPYMNMLLQKLLTFHAAMGGSAILLSATLPRCVRQLMVDSFARGVAVETAQVKLDHYPLATRLTRENGLQETPIMAVLSRKVTVEVKIVSEPNEILKLIVESATSGKCVCWIRNTVYDAIAGYEALANTLPIEKLLLFHGQFIMGDRLDIEKRVSEFFGKKSGEHARRGKVLVATQVVEQSLDLDFDLLISDLAPMDLLIQRAGRLHRHLRDERGNPMGTAEGEDHRGTPILIVHSPEPIVDAKGDWFKSMFPKGSYVYPSHGCLWLTARLLADRRTMRMPEDARDLIGAAFSEDADQLIPPPLRERDFAAEAKWQADKSLAHLNALKLDEGYAATTSQWLEDMWTPTRLGEMETTVRLASWDGTDLAPLHNDTDFPWDMSQVNIRSIKVFSEAEIHDSKLREVVDKLRVNLPDKGKWSVLIPMVDQGDGQWLGEAVNRKGQTVTISYNRTQGVAVIDKEANDDAIQPD